MSKGDKIAAKYLNKDSNWEDEINTLIKLAKSPSGSPIKSYKNIIIPNTTREKIKPLIEDDGIENYRKILETQNDMDDIRGSIQALGLQMKRLILQQENDREFTVKRFKELQDQDENFPNGKFSNKNNDNIYNKVSILERKLKKESTELEKALNYIKIELMRKLSDIENIVISSTSVDGTGPDSLKDAVFIIKENNIKIERLERSIKQSEEKYSTMMNNITDRLQRSIKDLAKTTVKERIIKYA